MSQRLLTLESMSLKELYSNSLHFPQDLLCVFLAILNNTIRKTASHKITFYSFQSGFSLPSWNKRTINISREKSFKSTTY